jgi:hypothetical protein
LRQAYDYWQDQPGNYHITCVFERIQLPIPVTKPHITQSDIAEVQTTEIAKQRLFHFDLDWLTRIEKNFD